MKSKLQLLLIAAAIWEQPRNSTPRLCLCSHSWITHRHTTRSSTRWAGHLNR
jgi:hypothetical protein